LDLSKRRDKEENFHIFLQAPLFKLSFTMSEPQNGEAEKNVSLSL
jgi:hypothetical protein